MTEDARWVVHKFGGTSVASAERYRNVAALLARQPAGPAGVVVSAMAKVTDALIALARQAAARDERYLTALQAIVHRHEEAAESLLAGNATVRSQAVPSISWLASARADLVTAYEALGRPRDADPYREPAAR